MTLQKLEALAATYGEQISYQSFYRHFTKHLEASIRQNIAMSLDTREIIRAKLEKEVQTVEEISKNLALCRALIEKMLSQEPSAQNIMAIKALMTEIRLTLDSTAKLRKEMALEEVDKEKILAWLMEKLEGIPEEKLGRSLVETPESNRIGAS